jgi:hypothetical protein
MVSCQGRVTVTLVTVDRRWVTVGVFSVGGLTVCCEQSMVDRRRWTVRLWAEGRGQ